jgi:hypothetical protein
LNSKHARASQTIAASPKYAQKECLMCHTTGYGKIGEYATVAEIPFYLRGVSSVKPVMEKGRAIRKREA